MKFFQNWLKKQRTKSEIELKNLALLFSLGITSVIFLVWIFTVINTRFNSNGPINTDENETGEITGPIETLIKDIKSIFESGKY
jgi:hypothetical protein